MLIIVSHQRNANENQEVPLRTYSNGGNGKGGHEDVEQLELSYIASGKCKMIQPLQTTIWQFLIKLNINLPYDAVILIQGMYPREMEIQMQVRVDTMEIAALFINM